MDFMCTDDTVPKVLDENFSHGGYDDDHEMIFPSVFFLEHLGGGQMAEASTATGVPRRGMTIEILAGKWEEAIHMASETRLLAWSEINDAGQTEPWTSEHVARKLDDAWDTSKRSREYLNAKDGELDSRYYVHGHSLKAVA